VKEEIESLQIRVHGNNTGPTLIYLPGIHGDWTLVRSFREAVKKRVRFVEITYPRTLTWSLDDYAAGVEGELARQGITGGWLLGESFSSQVVWAIAARGKFQANGIILAGGFVRYPIMGAVKVAEFLMPRIPLAALRLMGKGYRTFARWRYKHSPQTLENIDEFVARRTKLDWEAMIHRLGLIKGYDPRDVARKLTIPLYALTGLMDPVVPWVGVRPWLQRNCPGFRAARIVRKADHVVLGTAPHDSVAQVLQWMGTPVSDPAR
jgi:pimeloyl-ACP methyl ester carboxylesterase